MGYWLRVAKFPTPFANDAGGFTVVFNGKAYIEATNGRLYSWNGSDINCTLVADAPGAGIGMTDICLHNNAVYAASLDGHVYKWNGLSPAISKGGSGAWLNMGSIARPLYCIGSFNGSLYAGSAFEGLLYLVSGGNLTAVTGFLGAESELHFIANFNNTMYVTTAYNALLTKFTGNSLQNLTPATPKFLGEEIVYTIAQGSDGLIYGGSFGSGRILRWNGTNGWVEIYTIPANWEGIKDLHFIIAKGTKIYAVSSAQAAMVSYDIQTLESKVEVLPSIHKKSSQGLFEFNEQIYMTDNSIFLFVDDIVLSSDTVNEGDVKLFQGFDETDVGLENYDLIRDKGFETAIIISLFTNKRASINDVLPGATDDPFQTREGWWADNNTGSKLWLLGREKNVNSLLQKAIEYTSECLQWMLDDSVVSKIDVDAIRDSIFSVVISIKLYPPKGTPIYFRYFYNWVEQIYRRI